MATYQHHQTTVQIQKTQRKKTKVWCEKDYKNYFITSDYNFTR